jgi:membrane dipeptidase
MNASKLHEQAIVALTHDHTMYGLATHRKRGERAVFSSTYAPLVRQGGVNVIGWVVGGDHPLFGVESNDPWQGTLALIEMIRQEQQESVDSLAICLNSQDIDRALTLGKIAIILTVEGGKALCHGPDPLNNLQTLYTLGVRSLQLIGQGWNCLAKVGSTSHPDPSKGLTPLGKVIVQEMNRLGMLIDLAHVPDPDPLFWDVIELSQDPIIDSHRGVRGANDVPRNISDERIRAIATKGGLIGLQFFSVTLGSTTGERSNVDDLIRHIDHIVTVGGIDCVALGPDFLEAGLIDRPVDHYASGIETISQFHQVTEALVRHGYSEIEICKILGGNILHLYQKIIS